MATYHFFVSAEEALDAAIHGGPGATDRPFGSDEEAIESARAEGWEICLELDPFLPVGYRRVWFASDDE